jgi:hypothetical protein
MSAGLQLKLQEIQQPLLAAMGTHMYTAHTWHTHTHTAHTHVHTCDTHMYTHGTHTCTWHTHMYTHVTHTYTHGTHMYTAHTHVHTLIGIKKKNNLRKRQLKNPESGG